MKTLRYLIASALLVTLGGAASVRAEEKKMAPSELSRRQAEALRLEALKQRQAGQDLTLRAISSMRAKQHETIMLIIGNIAPSGRYEYNPATGRYDRYVPNR